nr:hypothetical protein Q903MT_gene1245 [Picea sitchensis]
MENALQSHCLLVSFSPSQCPENENHLIIARKQAAKRKRSGHEVPTCLLKINKKQVSPPLVWYFHSLTVALVWYFHFLTISRVILGGSKDMKYLAPSIWVKRD